MRPEVWNPYAYLRIFLPQKQLIWQSFWNFRQWGPISKGFFYLKTADFTMFCNFCEMGPSSKDFFWPKWDPCLRSFGKKVTHLDGTSPYALTCEYPPGFIWDRKLLKHRHHKVMQCYTLIAFDERVTFWLQRARVTALCVCVCCTVCMCDCIMVIRKPTCKKCIIRTWTRQWPDALKPKKLLSRRRQSNLAWINLWLE